MRDVHQVVSKLKIVLIPLGRDSPQSVLTKLRECIAFFLSRSHLLILFIIGDLWGPLLVCLLLSIILSADAPASSASLVFATVFVIVWCGAAVVTVNAQLLGGSISFFQSICILGYCVFPLTISALFNLFSLLIIGNNSFNNIVTIISVAIGFIWSTRGMYNGYSIYM